MRVCVKREREKRERERERERGERERERERGEREIEREKFYQSINLIYLNCITVVQCKQLLLGNHTGHLRRGRIVLWPVIAYIPILFCFCQINLLSKGVTGLSLWGLIALGDHIGRLN